MKITADTNLLVRIIVHDDGNQAQRAAALLDEAEQVAVSLPCLCEFVWVLGSVYKLSAEHIATAVRIIAGRNNVVIDDAGVAAGLSVLAAGGDFADGVIAVAGVSLGGETFVSFDRKAVARVKALGFSARNVTDFA